jgi:hypothetical protein
LSSVTFPLSPLFSETGQHHLASLQLSLSRLLSPDEPSMFTLYSSMADLAQRNKLGPWVHLVVVWVMGMDDNFSLFALYGDIFIAAFSTADLAGIVGTLDAGWATFSKVGMIFAVVNWYPSLQRLQSDH